jgi:hypothetical protein
MEAVLAVNKQKHAALCFARLLLRRPRGEWKRNKFFWRVISSWVAFDDRDLRIFPNYSNNSMNLFFFFLDSTLFRICNYGYRE